MWRHKVAALYTHLLIINMSMHTHLPSRGFTLIEVVMYIGLFSIVMSSSVVVVWQLVDGMRHDMQRITVQEEGNFVMQKIHRSLADAESVEVLGGAVSHEVVLHAAERITIRFHAASSSVEIQRGEAASFVPLTTPAVVVTNVVFTDVSYMGVFGMRATLTINDEVFEIEEYVRY